MSHLIDFENLPVTPRAFDIGTETQELNERLIMRAYAMVADAERLITEQRQRIKVLESLSFCDELTGVLNRRGFEMAFARELGSARRDPGSQGIVLLVDLDGFKQINDRFGHAAGDAYLVAVAQHLRGILRKGDVLARIGGDEFAILLPRCKETVGIRRAAQLQASLNATSLPWQTLALPLRASFGPAGYRGGDEAADVLKRADARLYSNKAARKTRRTA